MCLLEDRVRRSSPKPPASPHKNPHCTWLKKGAVGLRTQILKQHGMDKSRGVEGRDGV